MRFVLAILALLSALPAAAQALDPGRLIRALLAIALDR
jgi:hypothetical protein